MLSLVYAWTWRNYSYVLSGGSVMAVHWWTHLTQMLVLMVVVVVVHDRTSLVDLNLM